MKHLKWLLPIMRPNAWGYVAAFVFLLFEGWFALEVIAMQKWAIDDVFMTGDYGKLGPILWAMAGVFAGYILFYIIAPYMFRRNEMLLYRQLCRMLMSYMHKIPIAKLHNERTGKFVHYFTNDAAQAARTIGWDAARLVQQFLMVVFLVWFIGRANLPMLGMVLVFSVLYIWIGKKYAAPLKQVSKEVQERKAELTVHLEEGVSSTREVISYNRTAWETARYNVLFGLLFGKVMQEGKLENKQTAIAQPIRWGASLLVFAYGGYELMQGHLSMGMFVVLYQFSFSLMETLTHVFSHTMLFIGRIAFLDRINEVLEGERIADGEETIEGPIRSLRLEGIDFGYRDDAPQVLRDLTVALPVGRKIAFVGMSGGGKSTIAQLLVRFYEPGGGHIAVNGVPLNRIRRDDWMNRIDIVFQDPYLLPDTIRTNLALGREGVDEARIVEACRCAHIHDVFEALPEGYDTEVGERGITLSGGQRQRLALARAFLGDSELLILDEATSALDLETERRVMAELDKLRAGRTTIIIAHRLSTIMNADVIHVMDAGRIVESGTHAELMNGDTAYRKLVHAQEHEELLESGVVA